MTHAVLVRQTGGPEVLAYEEYDPGAPDADAVRVKVTASGVNFIDVYFRAGLYPASLPIVLGREGGWALEARGYRQAIESVGRWCQGRMRKLLMCRATA